MSSSPFSPCPPQLKTVQHYLKLAADYESREIVISYWARLYTLQTALKIDKKSPEARSFLTTLIDWLEKFKKDHADNEAITSDVAGQAVIENEAHKLFISADEHDRKGIFDKNTVKKFYTAGILFDVIEVFGNLSEEVAAQRKYSKWKATYIHNCLKNGEIPVPGPIGGDEAEDKPLFAADQQSELQDKSSGSGVMDLNLPSVPSNSNPGTSSPANNTHMGPDSFPSNYIPPTAPNTKYTPNAEIFAKAQKYCKFAISSIDYEDSLTAINYLSKALNLLTTGKE